jgi:hypothetical protein
MVEVECYKVSIQFWTGDYVTCPKNRIEIETLYNCYRTSLEIDEIGYYESNIINIYIHRLIDAMNDFRSLISIYN